MVCRPWPVTSSLFTTTSCWWSLICGLVGCLLMDASTPRSLASGLVLEVSCPQPLSYGHLQAASLWRPLAGSLFPAVCHQWPLDRVPLTVVSRMQSLACSLSWTVSQWHHLTEDLLRATFNPCPLMDIALSAASRQESLASSTLPAGPFARGLLPDASHPSPLAQVLLSVVT